MKFKGVLRKYTTQSNVLQDSYILSAVRTPIGFVNGYLRELDANQLGGHILKNSLIRARVPADDIKDIFVGCALNVSHIDSVNILSIGGLKKKTKLTFSVSGLQSIAKACKHLSKTNDACAVVGVESLSSDTTKSESLLHSISENFARSVKPDADCYVKSYKNLLTGYRNKVFDDEISKILFTYQSQMEFLYQDEALEIDCSNIQNNIKRMAEPADGACGLVLASKDFVDRNKLVPIAKIISIEEKSSNSLDGVSTLISCIYKTLNAANCKLSDISLWEIDDFCSNFCTACIKELKINKAKVNRNGSSLSLGYPIGMSGARILTHLTHLLPTNKLGCAAACNVDGSATAVIIQKGNVELSDKPRLVLYTKTTCSLCDEMKELIRPWGDRFTLEHVFIDAEENKKLRKLYRYDIPVMFLDGLFLCNHKLDLDYFKKRLARSENSRIS